MKCKNCRYLSKENFENTDLRTCNVAYYIIQKLKKEGWKIYDTEALMNENQKCEIQKIFTYKEEIKNEKH